MTDNKPLARAHGPPMGSFDQNRPTSPTRTYFVLEGLTRTNKAQANATFASFRLGAVAMTRK